MIKKTKAGKSSKPAGKPNSPVKRPARTFSIAKSAQGTVKQRVAALREAPLGVAEGDKNLQAALKVLSNKDEPVKVRLAALGLLHAATFSVDVFESCRKDYIATLRGLVDDKDLELRQRVLGILAREKDGLAQKKLLEGLQNPEKALVPPEKALQLLSYDVHAEAYSIAREIVSKPPNEAAKREALRLLAADAAAAPIFEKILRDKKELRENRQIAASALQALKPEKLLELARELLLDKSEYEDIQATSMTALGQFGNEKVVENDEALLKSVDRLKSGEASTRVKQHAGRFLSKFSR